MAAINEKFLLLQILTLWWNKALFDHEYFFKLFRMTPRRLDKEKQHTIGNNWTWWTIVYYSLLSNNLRCIFFLFSKDFSLLFTQIFCVQKFFFFCFFFSLIFLRVRRIETINNRKKSSSLIGWIKKRTIEWSCCSSKKVA